MNQTNNSFKNLVNNPGFILIASLASILSLFLGFTIFFPPEKRPFYSVKSFNLINNSSSNIENLDIKYKLCNSDQENTECELKNIESLTITKIFLWNGGRRSIDKADIDDGYIKILASEDNIILEAKIIHSSNDRNDLSLNSENNTINFDFLDSSNGGVIEVIHTGLSDENISLDGYIIESRFNGEIKRQELKYIYSRLPFSIIFLLGLVFTIIILVGFAMFFITRIINKGIRPNRVMGIILSIMQISVCFLLINQLYLPTILLRYPSSSFEVFNSEIAK